MLDMKRNASFTGYSRIGDDGKIAERFTASINADNPEDIQLGETIMDKDLYRDNRDECHKDEAEFEDVVFGVQEEMLEVDAMKEE